MEEDFEVLETVGPLGDVMDRHENAIVTPNSAMGTATNIRYPANGRNTELGPSIFEKPVCLIESAPDGKLMANEKAVRQLEIIDKTVNCVAIAGLYRTGKSYLLNRLAGSSSGFALGSTIESKTKGIWVWCTPHPRYPDQVLVLLDTEGLGDVAKGDQNHDNWIFALAVLLSSTLVYNTLGAIDQGAIEKLNFVTEISKHLKTKRDGSETKDFDLYFPNFVFSLRDFSLDLTLDDREITADQYLEHALTFKIGSDDRTTKYNEPRKCIRRYFKHRKCFTFERPGNSKTLKKLEELKDSDLDSDFLANVEDFCHYIYQECPPKKLDIGTPVTGRMFATLVRSYVDAIRNGAVPCVENALNTMAKLENTKAVEEAIQFYGERMTKNLNLPTDSDDKLSQVHHKALEESVAVFLKKAIYDTDNKFQRNMNEEVERQFIEWKNQNEQVSVEKCRQVLLTLYGTIAKNMEDGVYFCKGGYAVYQHDLHGLQMKYKATEGLGVKAKDSLLAFLNEKWTEGQSILKADEKVSAEEKKLEDQRQKVQEAERQRQAAEREAALKEQHAKDVERMMKENVEQLEKKREEDMENMKKHNEEVLQSRLLEQQRTLQEGFQKDAKTLMDEINELKSQQKEAKGGCFADTSLVRVQRDDGLAVKIPLSELQVGDRVESYDFQTKTLVFSDVYFIAHSSEGDTYGNVLLHLKFEGSGKRDGIRLDDSHLLYVSRSEELYTIPPNQPTRASEVKTGDRVWIREGETLIPRKVTEIRETKSGIRHPMTINHVIIVDDVLASVHMHHERIYRVLTSPLRLLYAASPGLVQSRFVSNVVSAWDYVEKLM